MGMQGRIFLFREFVDFLLLGSKKVVSKVMEFQIFNKFWGILLTKYFIKITIIPIRGIYNGSALS